MIFSHADYFVDNSTLVDEFWISGRIVCVDIWDYFLPLMIQLYNCLFDRQFLNYILRTWFNWSCVGAFLNFHGGNCEEGKSFEEYKKIKK